jgi:predicted XRE-type DNA-binding protein
MSTYTVTATREGKWWVLDVEGVGVTQARTLAAAEEWVRDLIQTMTGDDDARFEISVEVEGADVDAAKDAQQRLSEAEREMRDAAAVVRTVVRDLAAAGVSQQDSAEILHVSRQRVQQLCNA